MYREKSGAHAWAWVSSCFVYTVRLPICLGCETMGLTLLVFEMEVLYILKIRSTLALVTSATRSIEVSKMSATFWAMMGMLALSLR